MKFIKLQSAYSQDIIAVAPGSIEVIYSTDNEGNTTIILKSGKFTNVKETQDEILKLIKEIE